MKTLQEIKDIRAAKCGQIDIRFNPDTAEEAVKTYVLVCGGTGCQSNHSVEVIECRIELSVYLTGIYRNLVFQRIVNKILDH